eukprot:32917-Eustigmatos_ZCMA.PRE.1
MHFKHPKHLGYRPSLTDLSPVRLVRLVILRLELGVDRVDGEVHVDDLAGDVARNRGRTDLSG